LQLYTKKSIYSINSLVEDAFLSAHFATLAIVSIID